MGSRPGFEQAGRKRSCQSAVYSSHYHKSFQQSLSKPHGIAKLHQLLNAGTAFIAGSQVRRVLSVLAQPACSRLVVMCTIRLISEPKHSLERTRSPHPPAPLVLHRILLPSLVEDFLRKFADWQSATAVENVCGFAAGFLPQCAESAC